MAKYSGEITLAKVQDGSSGVSCTGSASTYQVGTSGTVKPTGTWSTAIPAVTAGQYLWVKTTFTYSDSSTSDIYSVSYMGTNGTQGIDGKSVYMHTRFSPVANPTASQMSITPDKYIGLCVNNNSTAPTSPSSYTWTKFQGDDGQDGAQGAPGVKGADGTTYYVHFAYAESADGQTGFSTTSTAGKSYIGTCTTTSATKPTTYSSYTWAKTKGDKGDKGDDGVGISSVTEHYAVSTSSTTAPTTWSSTPPTMSTANKYLWNYETLTFTDQNTLDTKKRVIGVYGDTGQTGSAGKGISSVTNYYLASASSTGVTTSTTGWTTTVQSVSATKKNLWNYEVIKYTDNSTTATMPCIIGVYGDKGDKGDTGQGIDSITPEYYVSTSNTTQAGGSWSTTMPAWAANKYCWVRNKIVYKNPVSTVYTTAQLDTNWNKMNDLDSKTTVLQTTVTQEQGKLAALIKQTDTDRKNTSDKFTEVTADINGINTTIGNIQTAVDDNADDITTINSQITTINATAAGLETKVAKAQNDATAAQSKATQAADKIGLVVQSGTSQSNLTLTPGALSTIANNIDLTGKVTFNSLDSATQNRLDNNNILSIQIVPSYSGNTCTLTAHVYKGQTELTDVQVTALGCLKYYVNGTFIANGKQLTRTLTGRETIECRLESGGGGLMPEFITLADGSLAVKGRNLLRYTQTTELESTDAGHLQTRLLPLAIDCKALQGQNIAISIQCDCENAVAKTTSGPNRMGYELNVGFEDGTSQYIGMWVNFSSTPRTVHSKFSKTYTILDKPIKRATPSRLYLQHFTADSAKVSKPKLEFGTEATPYSPAPEDEEVTT